MAFFTGMRHIQPKIDLITKTRKLVNAGLIKEAPAWLIALERLPPQVTPPREGRGVPKIELPTDRLFHLRQVRNPASRNEPFFARGELQSATLLFAERQLALMNEEGLSEADAYTAVEKQMEDMKSDALKGVRALTESVRREGAEAALPSALSGGGAGAAQLAQWHARLAEEPWEAWDFEQQVSLDHWICTTALSWGWEQERYLRHEDFAHELARLRSALFGAAISDPDEAAEAQVGSASSGLDGFASDIDLEALLDAQDWDDPILSDLVNAWYQQFGKWQTKAFRRSDFSTWPDKDKEELDMWILENCLPKDAMEGLSDEDAANALEAARWKLLPRLDPQQVRGRRMFRGSFPLTSFYSPCKLQQALIHLAL